MLKIVALLFAGALLGACAGQAPEPPMGAELHQTCPEPRPQMCTLEYAPVCALLDKQAKRKEYASGCAACSDPEVTAYIAGPCPDSGG